MLDARERNRRRLNLLTNGDARAALQTAIQHRFMMPMATEASIGFHFPRRHYLAHNAARRGDVFAKEYRYAIEGEAAYGCNNMRPKPGMSGNNFHVGSP